MNREFLNRLCDEACEQNLPLLSLHSKITKLNWVAPPRPTSSFGLIGDWVAVGEEVTGASTRLFIPFQPERLSWVKRETLRLFRFDTKEKQFQKIDDALFHTQYPAVYATIDKPGFYGLIGLNSHPLVRETIGLFSDLKPMMGVLPAALREAFRDRICKLIMCAPDMNQLIDSRGKLAELMKQLGRNLPDAIDPLPRLARPGETLCDRCYGIDIVDLPEWHILKEPRADLPCAPAKWENVGPKHISGAMRQIVIDPTNHRRLYAVSANGGIWRLNNVDSYPRVEWRPLTDNRTNLRFRTMAIAPNNSSVLYGATSVKELLVDPIRVYSEIYRSRTGGSAWLPIHQSGIGVVHRLAVHPANSDIVFAASSTGLWCRGENGTWTNVFLDDCLDVALDPDDSSIIYLGVRAKGIFKSFTSGADWSAEPILEYDPAGAGVTDAGSSPNREAIKIALGKRNVNGTEQTPTTRTVAVRFGDEFCISHTSGEGGPGAWQRSSLGNFGGASANRSDTDPIRQHEWCNCLAVEPFDPLHILAGGTRLAISTDGGRNWTFLISRIGDISHEDQHSIVFDEDENRKDLVFLANDGGIFSSRDGGETWPTMSLADTIPIRGQGINLAQGLITSEFRSSVVRSGRCMAAIDHTGFILSENLDNNLWQFVFGGNHGHEDSVVFACPASLNRYYVIDDGDHVFQVDFTRTNGLVASQLSGPLSARRTFFSNWHQPSSRPATPINYIPETNIYLNYVPGAFAVRFSPADGERLLLYGAGTGSGNRRLRPPFIINSLRLATNGTDVIDETQETADSNEPFLAITFVPDDPDRAFAITERGTLLERDFSAPGQFVPVGQWHLPAGNEFVFRLIAVPGQTLRLYALSQRALARFDDGSLNSEPTMMEWDRPNETLIALAVHPTRRNTLFLGTNRGVYFSDDGGSSFQPYRAGMPRVPVTELTFDEGYLYAATFGRGLWRCLPCPSQSTRLRWD